MYLKEGYISQGKIHFHYSQRDRYKCILMYLDVSWCILSEWVSYWDTDTPWNNTGYGSRYPLRHVGYPVAAHAATTLGMLSLTHSHSLSLTHSLTHLVYLDVSWCIWTGHIKIHIKIHSEYIEIQYDTYPIGNVPQKDRKSTVTRCPPGVFLR